MTWSCQILLREYRPASRISQGLMVLPLGDRLYEKKGRSPSIRDQLPRGTPALCLGASRIVQGITLRIDLPAQVFPYLVRHVEKDLNHFGIKLPPGPLRDLLPCGLQRLSRPVNPVGCDGVERVGNRENARSERDLFSLQVPRIAGAVETFLVGIHNFSRVH